MSKLPPTLKKYKTALFRRRVIERLRLQMVTGRQVLTQLDISRTLPNHWNRTYQRYQHTWCGAARAVQARPISPFYHEQAWYDEQKREDSASLQAGLLLDEVRRPTVG